MSRKKRSATVYHSPLTDAEIQKYREDDRPVKIVIGGFHVNHRLGSAREFKRALQLPLILLGACLLGLALYAAIAALLTD